MKKISRTNDLAFKKAFSSNGNTKPIIGLAKDILGIEIKEIIFKQPYTIESYSKNIKEIQTAKYYQTIKDIAADAKINYRGVNVISELQVKEGIKFLERSFFYPTETFAQNYDENKYDSLKPIYAINILGFKMFKQDLDGLRIFEMYDRKHNESFPINFNVAYFEYKKEIFDTDVQKYWRDYFLDKEILDNAPDYIKSAAETVEYANLNKEEREMIDMLERIAADQKAREDWVRYDDIKKSIEIMTELNIPFKTIIEKITQKYNITVEQVNELLNDSSY